LFRPFGHHGYEARHRHLMLAGDDCVSLSGRSEVLLTEDKQEEDQTHTLRRSPVAGTREMNAVRILCVQASYKFDRDCNYKLQHFERAGLFKSFNHLKPSDYFTCHQV
jgi:hypothetical protein